MTEQPIQPPVATTETEKYRRPIQELPGGKLKDYIEQVRQMYQERRAKQEKNVWRNNNGEEVPEIATEITPEATPPLQEQPTALPTNPETENQSQVFELNSDTLVNALDSGKVKKVPNGKFDGVALFGSTHALANWREESVGPALAQSEIVSYNPRMQEWDDVLHPKAEAMAMTEMSVLAMRIENDTIENGSLGSMVEMGIAVLSAALNGQRIVVSIEANIEASLTEPGALAQYKAMEKKIENAEKKYPHLITVQRGGSLEEFSGAIKDAVGKQRSEETCLKPMSVEQFARHAEAKKKRLGQKNTIKVQGGSSAPFSPILAESFNNEQDKLRATWNNNVVSLNKEPIASIWKTIDSAPPELKAQMLRIAFMAEQSIKDEADVLTWVIQDEAVSKAAITEIGFMLLDALESGQQMMLVMEPFKRDVYVRTVFKDKLDTLREEKNRVVTDASTTGSPIAEADIATADAILADLQEGRQDAVTPKRVKESSVLKKTRMFADFDNAGRTRSVIEAQMKRLLETLQKRSQEGAEFFTFATNPDEYAQQVAKVKADYMADAYPTPAAA
jgi:hypothetical protein